MYFHSVDISSGDYSFRIHTAGNTVPNQLEMGFLGKIRQSPLFHLKRKRFVCGIAVKETFDQTEAEDISSASSVDASFDILFAERNAKGLLPLRQDDEEESTMMDSDDISLLCRRQSSASQKSRFSSFDGKIHDHKVEEDITAEYEPPIMSPWHQGENDEGEGKGSPNLEGRKCVPLTVVGDETVNDSGSCINERNTGFSNHQARNSSGNLGHIFIDELPTLYEDEVGRKELARRDDESTIRARWDSVLECMSSMGQCAEDTSYLSVLSSSFAKPNLSPSMRFKMAALEVAEI